MSLRLPGYAHWLSPPADFDRDAELLQTDVMRFLAVFGFILMGIFALVQSLPVTSPREAKPELEDRASLKRDIANLEAYLGERRAELRMLRARIADARAMRQRLASQSAAFDERLQRALGRMQEVDASLEEERRALVRIKQDLDRESQALNDLRARVERKRVALRRVQARLDSLTAQVEALRVQRERAIAEKGPLREAAPAPAAQMNEGREALARAGLDDEAGAREAERARRTEAVAQATKTPEKKAVIPDEVPRRGFTLKFESEAAFNRLVAEESIAFYALAGDRSWRASRLGRVAQFRVAETPRRYHEMTRATVPEDYIKSFRIVAAVHGEGGVTWAVVLPEPMVRAIRARIENKTSADIVILDSGAIRLENVRS